MHLCCISNASCPRSSAWSAIEVSRWTRWASVTRSHTLSPQATAGVSHTTLQKPPKQPASWVPAAFQLSTDLKLLTRQDLIKNKCAFRQSLKKQSVTRRLKSGVPALVYTKPSGPSRQSRSWCSRRPPNAFDPSVHVSGWHICEGRAGSGSGLLLPRRIFII